MGRVVLYSLLLCAITFTAYLLITGTEDVPVTPQAIVVPPEKPGESPVPGSTLQERSVPEIPSEPSLSPDPLAPVPAGAETDQKIQKERRLASKAGEIFQSGDYEGAAALYRDLSEWDKSACAGAGISYFKLGDLENAKTFLEKAVEHDPNNFNARKFLAFLYYRKDDVERGLSHAGAGLSLKKDPELQKLYEKLLKEKNIQEGYESESAQHFRIAFDGYKHGGISRKVIEILEDAYSTVGKEFGYFPAEPVSAILYTNRDFYDITQAPEWSSGIYDGKIRIPVRGAEANELLLKKVLFHEYTHSVVRSLTSKCPLWINEGLAEYFSKNYQKKVGQIIPLGSLGSSFSWLNRENVALAYWESYSAVSHLVEKHGFYRMKEFLLSLSRETGLEQAFKDSFGVSYSEFVSSWGKG